MFEFNIFSALNSIEKNNKQKSFMFSQSWRSVYSLVGCVFVKYYPHEYTFKSVWIDSINVYIKTVISSVVFLFCVLFNM